MNANRKASPELLHFIALVHSKGERASPYRVACYVGEAGADVACPYAPGTKWAKAWASGLVYGRETAEKRKIMAT